MRTWLNHSLMVLHSPPIILKAPLEKKLGGGLFWNWKVPKKIAYGGPFELYLTLTVNSKIIHLYYVITPFSKNNMVNTVK